MSWTFKRSKDCAAQKANRRFDSRDRGPNKTLEGPIESIETLWWAVKGELEVR